MALPMGISSRCRSLILLLVLIPSADAFATSYASPEKRKVYSANREFYLFVDPESQTQVVYASSSNDALWSFQLHIWHYPFLVSNDGQTVAVVAWQHVKEDNLGQSDCVTFFQSDGTRKGIPFDDVYHNPPRTSSVTIGPIGDFWRTWYHDVESSGDTFTIQTTGGGYAKFDLRSQSLVRKGRVGLFKPLNILAVVVVSGIVGIVWYRNRGARAVPSTNSGEPSDERADWKWFGDKRVGIPRG